MADAEDKTKAFLVSELESKDRQKAQCVYQSKSLALSITFSQAA